MLFKSEWDGLVEWCEENDLDASDPNAPEWYEDHLQGRADDLREQYELDE